MAYGIEAVRNLEASAELPQWDNTPVPDIVPIDDDFGKNPHLLKKSIVGGKGRGLLIMSGLGLNVPPGFIMTTASWNQYKESGQITEELLEKTYAAIGVVESKAHSYLGDNKNPLLLSFRSGASVSMPGAMESILSVGITSKNIGALKKEIGETAALEAYFKLIEGLAVNTLGVDKLHFKTLVASMGVNPTEPLNRLSVFQLEYLVDKAKKIFKGKSVYKNYKGMDFPDSTDSQVILAIYGVYHSWDSKRAASYRANHGISYNMGTAICVQQMVYANAPSLDSGAAVVWTQNPSNLYPEPVIAFKKNAMGTDVVGDGKHETKSLSDFAPRIRDQLVKIIETVKQYGRRIPQDIELSIDKNGVIHVLQMRDLMLLPVAQFKLALDMIGNELTEDEASRTVFSSELDAILTPLLDPKEIELALLEKRDVGHGQRYIPGHATAPLVHSIKEAIETIGPVIINCEIDIDDLPNLPKNIVGYAAVNAGNGSHIGLQLIHNSIVSGKQLPVIFGVQGLEKIKTGTIVTIDGDSGNIFEGKIDETKENFTVDLTPEQIAVAKKWRSLHNTKPWSFSIRNATAFSRSLDLAQQELDTARGGYSAHKALETHLLSTIIPDAIRMNYSIFKPNQIDQIKTRLRIILDAGHHASVRTCFTPHLKGKGPWAPIQTYDDIDELFNKNNHTQTKYGNFFEMTRPNGDHTVTEILAGQIPFDKLNPNEQIQKEHCAWTLSCSPVGEIVLQVHPFSSQLRALLDTKSPDVITYTIKPRRLNSQEWYYSINVGKNLEEDREALVLGQYVLETMLGEWQPEHKIFERLAAIEEVLPAHNYATPVLEGQARIGQWVKIYGLSADKSDNGNANH